jgi:hypothetical protein
MITTEVKADQSDFEIFADWYQKFSDKHKLHYGYAELVPKDYKAWYEQVEANHKKIRQELGGIRHNYRIDLVGGQSAPDQTKLNYIVFEILRYAPKFLEKTGTTLDIFTKGIMPNGQKIGRAISAYVREYWDGTLESYNKQYIEVYVKTVQTLLAKLGDLLANSETKDETIVATVTTAPKAFILIGHYGPDEVSCFRHGGQNAHHKYNFGARPETFVVLIKTTNSRMPESEDSKTTRARMLGWYNPNDKIVNFCNFYTRDSFRQAQMEQAAGIIASNILGVPADKLKKYNKQFSLNPINLSDRLNVFQNSKEDQPNWSFTANLKCQIPYQYLGY